jgi:hypothetical protein
MNFRVSPETSRKLLILRKSKLEFLVLWTRPQAGRHSVAKPSVRPIYSSYARFVKDLFLIRS